jgi:hypothetical protein
LNQSFHLVMGKQRVQLVYSKAALGKSSGVMSSENWKIF